MGNSENWTQSSTGLDRGPLTVMDHIQHIFCTNIKRNINIFKINH